jgi:hypothetical protein
MKRLGDWKDLLSRKSEGVKTLKRRTNNDRAHAGQVSWPRISGYLNLKSKKLIPVLQMCSVFTGQISSMVTSVEKISLKIQNLFKICDGVLPQFRTYNYNSFSKN